MNPPMPNVQITHRLGIRAAALDADPRQAAIKARAGGFAGIHFDAKSPDIDLTALSQSGRREFRQIVAAQQLQLIGLNVSLGPKGLGASADLDHILDRLRKIIETAAGLAAPLICLDIGPLPEPPRIAPQRPAIAPQQAGLLILPDPPKAQPAPFSEPIPLDAPFAARVDSTLSELGSIADRFGATIAFRTDLASHAALDRAMASANCPWFGIDLDPVAILRDQWTLDEILSCFAGRIKHFRARDAALGADRRTQPTPIGQGSTHWPDLLAALDAAGYPGWLTIDPLDLPDRSQGALQATAVLSGHGS